MTETTDPPTHLRALLGRMRDGHPGLPIATAVVMDGTDGRAMDGVHIQLAREQDVTKIARTYGVPCHQAGRSYYPLDAATGEHGQWWWSRIPYADILSLAA